MVRKAFCYSVVWIVLLTQVMVAQVSEQSITSEAIASALADVGAMGSDKEMIDTDNNAGAGTADHLDVAKINSSIEKTGINADQLEETITKLSKTCAELSGQINDLTDALTNLKKSARIHFDRDKTHIAQLAAQVQALEAAVKREQAAKAAAEKQVSVLQAPQQPNDSATVVTVQAIETVTSSTVNAQD